MKGQSQRFFRVWIVASAAAILAWHFFPGTPPDKQAFHTIAQLSHRESIQTAGQGSHDSPWQMVRPHNPEIIRQLPAIVSLTDDKEGVFQNSPHAPIDFAVIFSNLHRLGAKKIACATLLAWEKPDPIGLEAMEQEMARFDSVLIAAPVTRGAIMEPLPEAFRRASIPIEEIGGNPSALPVVNRVSLPNMIYGNDRSLAGFQVIDSETDGPHLPLVARWDYRVILAFPLLAVMQQLNVQPQELEIHVGKAIHLGPKGPIIPIDEFGRLADPGKHEIWSQSIAAEKLIDATPANVSRASLERVLLSDGRSHTDARLTKFNQILPLAMASIASGGETTDRINHIRLSTSQEIYALLLFALLLASMTPVPGSLRITIYLLMIALVITGQYLAATFLHLWPPGGAAISAIIAAALSAIPTKRETEHGVVLTESDRLTFVRYSGP